MRRVRVFLVRFGLLVVGSALGSAHAALLGEDDLADVVRKPAIGLYKGYAEFKMAHYAEARQIWMALAERGMGIAVLDPSLVREQLAQGRLQQVLPEWAAPRLPMHALMSSRMQPASVRALIDFLVARLVV